jgi:hypothetical protein
MSVPADESSSVVNRVAACLEAALYRDPHTEIELRLGTHGHGGRFSAGVPRESFEHLEADLLDAPGLQVDEGWTELVDYYYTTARGERARTRVTFDSERMELSTEHVSKRARQSVVVRRDGDDAYEACRVACASETPLATPPTVCVPSHVRIQQRRRFRDVRDGKVVWSCEISKTWSASSRSAVEHLQHVAPPVYEVECELVDEGGAYRAAHDPQYVAASLLMKTRGLMGSPTAELSVVADATAASRGKRPRE